MFKQALFAITLIGGAAFVSAGSATAQVPPSPPAAAPPPTAAQMRQMAPAVPQTPAATISPEQMMQAIYSAGFSTGQQVQAALAAKQKELDDKDAEIAKLRDAVKPAAAKK